MYARSLSLLVLVLAACGKSPAGAADASTTPGFDKPALLAAIAACQHEQAGDFAARAATLKTATAAHAAAPSAETLAAARTAWSEAMASWQRLEAQQLGPAAASDEPGGQDLRDQIYGWPLLARCKIDEQTVDQTYADAGFATSLVNGRGLGAIEYLLFYEAADNGCGPFSAINNGNGDGTWAALGDAEVAARRRDYAAAAATLVDAHAAQLTAAWAPGGGNFRAELESAGHGSTLFKSEQAGLNAASNALFYADKLLKDTKLARPLGLMDCAGATCPEALESIWAGQSAAHVVGNLDGFAALFGGCAAGGGLGFDDWLRAAGAADLATRIDAAVADARAAALALAPSLADELGADEPAVEALHAKVKVLTDAIKSELVSVLDLELPGSVESDND